MKQHKPNAVLRGAQVEVAEWKPVVLEQKNSLFGFMKIYFISIIFVKNRTMGKFNTLVTILLLVPEHWCPLGDLDLSTPLVYAYVALPRDGVLGNA